MESRKSKSDFFCYPVTNKQYSMYHQLHGFSYNKALIKLFFFMNYLNFYLLDYRAFSYDIMATLLNQNSQTNNNNNNKMRITLVDRTNPPGILLHVCVMTSYCFSNHNMAAGRMSENALTSGQTGKSMFIL